jgi:hypothetical protein
VYLIAKSRHFQNYAKIASSLISGAFRNVRLMGLAISKVSSNATEGQSGRLSKRDVCIGYCIFVIDSDHEIRGEFSLTHWPVPSKSVPDLWSTRILVVWYQTVGNSCTAIFQSKVIFSPKTILCELLSSDAKLLTNLPCNASWNSASWHSESVSINVFVIWSPKVKCSDGRNSFGDSVRLFVVGLVFRASMVEKVVYLIGTRRHCIVGGYLTLAYSSSWTLAKIRGSRRAP